MPFHFADMPALNLIARKRRDPTTQEAPRLETKTLQEGTSIPDPDTTLAPLEQPVTLPPDGLLTPQTYDRKPASRPTVDIRTDRKESPQRVRRLDAATRASRLRLSALRLLEYLHPHTFAIDDAVETERDRSLRLSEALSDELSRPRDYEHR